MACYGPSCHQGRAVCRDRCSVPVLKPRASLPTLHRGEHWLERAARRTGLWAVYRLFALAWWRWAGRELASWCPMHHDLPGIVRRINELDRGRA